jgi:hypothetical protein
MFLATAACRHNEVVLPLGDPLARTVTDVNDYSWIMIAKLATQLLL